MPAVEVSLDDKSYCQPVNVSISGKYRWRLIGSDTFDGDIKFSAYPFTMENELTRGKGIPALRLVKGSDSLDYGPWGESTIFGNIYTTALFNQFIVTVYKPYKFPDGGRGGSWSTKDGKCIVAPATKREEALAILKKISHQRLPPYEYWIN